MTKFTIGAFENRDRTASDFPEFVSIVKGRSIISAAEWGKGRFELGLSGGAMLRIFTGVNTNPEVNLVQTINADELPPFMISLGDMAQRVPLAIIERKLRGLRTLYAVYFLYHTGRSEELYAFLEATPNGDIERSLISEADSLHIESISYGSWVLAVWAKTKDSYRAISSVAGLVFHRGREAYLSKIEAGARLAQAKAKREEIAAAKDEFDLKKSQFDYLMKVLSKAPTPEVRQRLESIMIEETQNLTAHDPGDSKSYERLAHSDQGHSGRSDG